MPEKKTKQRLLVGLGSHHGDDQVGWLLVEALGKHTSFPVRLAAVPADLIHWLDGVDELFLCDACQGTKSIGSLHRWEYRAESQPLEGTLKNVEVLRSTSSHHLSLAAVLELAQSLGLLPERVVIWAIEGRCFGAGQMVSEELTRQLPELVNQFVSEFTHA